ncbi:hypothetical protein E8E13_009679 [Curvularia kusanoi]|uniref:F-box domain-containing protein n=1 Tax=Curvularia kusanoi TaxID=90978 RepID=A0A9P4TM07_CURKU|nr:hypothetical protein E8E13_009679 [Curvularia kusanoi]
MSIFQAPFRLLDLPPELISAVCDYLPGDELKHIRSVCSHLRDHSTPAFGQRFLDHLIVILHPVSLDIFLDIARHEQLSKYVRRVSVSGESIENATPSVPDLQVEASRSQSDILLEAFLLMKNLRTLRVDAEQFNHRHYYPGSGQDLSLSREMRPGVACGSKQIPEEDYDLPQLNGWCSSVYRLALGALERAHRSEIDLEMSFVQWLIKPNGTEGAARFDVQSPLWKSQGPARVRHLGFRFELDFTWGYDLLKSVTNLHSLHVDCYNEMTFYEFQACFRWPHLARINLRGIATTHGGFVEFLKAHQNNLEDVFLSKIGFAEGTWSAPLTILSRMPKLKLLFLDLLFEQEAYRCSDLSDDQLGPECGRLSVTGTRRVASAIEAIRQNMITVPTDDFGESYIYHVDLSPGIEFE